MAAGCAACHATTDRGDGPLRALAGMPRAQVAQAMRAFKSGERPGTVMPQLAKGYTDREIDLIAEAIASRDVAR